MFGTEGIHVMVVTHTNELDNNSTLINLLWLYEDHKALINFFIWLPNELSLFSIDFESRNEVAGKLNHFKHPKNKKDDPT